MRRFRGSVYLVGSWFSLACLHVAAEPNVDPATDEALLQELMAVLEEGTEIATKSRMNADFVPGIVSVLQGRELETLGMQTVWEALSLIPGIRTSRKGIGEPLLGVRGINFPFSSGNIKVLLNSVSMNRESAGNNTSVLLLPISQVDRIEIVRGPASVLYGDFAFMGVVNIITRKGERGAAVSTTDTGSREAHGRYTWATAEAARQGTAPLKVDLNLAARQGTAYATQQLIDPEEDYFSGVLALEWGGLQLQWQSVTWDTVTAETFGGDDTHHALDMRYSLTPTPATTLQLRASFTTDDTRVSDTLGGPVQQDARRAIKGDTREVGMDMSWQASPRHTWLFGASYTEEQIAAGAIFPLPTPQGLQEVTFPASSRHYAGFSVQDHFSVRDDLVVTLGLRYDYREDLDQERLTPRLAAVWNFAEGHTLKAQYAEGFRAPTFFELLIPDGTQRNLELETVGTTELSYIYRQTNAVARLTLFDSRIENMIFVRNRDFGNVAEGQAQGVELEWEQQVNPRFKWQAHAAYVDSWTTRNEANVREADPSAADWLASLSVLVKPADKLLLTGRWAYVGAINDPEVDVPAQHTVDVTMSAFDLGAPGLTLRAGVKNLFDEDILYPLTIPAGTLVFAFPGRAAWLQLSLDF